MYKTLKRFTTIAVLFIGTIGMAVVYLSTSLIMLFVGMLLVGVGLLIVPSLMMDNNKLIKEESITFAASMVIIFMDIGDFLAGYFLQIVFGIAKNLTMPYPGLFISIMCMVVLTLGWFIVRLVQKDSPQIQAQK